MSLRIVLFTSLFVVSATVVDNLVYIRHVNLNKRLNPERSLVFEANRGQAPGKYTLLARDAFGAFLVAGDEFVYGRGSDAVRVVFAGANPRAQAVGADAQPGRINYLIGNDAAAWIRDIASYARARVDSLYSGIDAVYYGSQGSLEADFIVQTGADPNAIKLRIEGAGKPSITGSGDLQVQTRRGLFALRRPKASQRAGRGRRQVACRYALLGGGEIGFSISNYDRSQPLMIDPVLAYSTYIGGSGNETAVRVALDSQGNAYLAGATTSLNYPVTPGAVPPPSSSNRNDVLITKFNSQGALVYATHVGGAREDIGLGVSVDSSGQAYVTGSTASKDFPEVNAFQPAYQGGSADAFVFALNAAGNGFAYSTYLGGNATDFGTAIAVDSQGNAYVAGGTVSPNFPVVNPAQASLKGGRGGSNQFFFTLGDAFVTKLTPAGKLVYSTYYGGSDDDAPLAIAIDSTGSAYVAGFTVSSDFPLKSPLQPKYGGAGSNSQIETGDAFVFKLTPDGSQVVYSTYLGGSADDVACGIAVDAFGNAYVAGSTFSSNFPVASAAQTAYGGQGVTDYFRMSSGDGFVAKINATGTALVFSTYLGGSDDDRAFAIALDGAGNIHVAGNTASSNFPVTADAAQRTLGGTSVVDTMNLLPGGFVKAPVGFGDAFYARFSPNGTLAYNTYLGGSQDDVASGLAVDSAGNAYLSGNTSSGNFPLAGASYQKQLGGMSAEDSSGRSLTSLLFGDAFFAIFQAPAATPAIRTSNGVISAGQFGAFSSIAPGSWIEIYGTNLAATTRQWTASDFQGNQAPTSLDQARVTIGGQPAFIDYISPGQVNAQAPSTIGTGPQPVVVTTPGGSSAPYMVTVNPVQPGLLAPSVFSIGGVQYVAALFPDGVTFVLPPAALAGVASRRAQGGDTIILYGVGFGPVTPPIPAGQIVPSTNMLTNFQIFIAGTPATVQYAGLAPGYVGLYQFNVVVPNVTSGDMLPVTFSVGGASSSQTLYTAVQ